MIKIQIIGRLGSDATTKQVSDKFVTHFSVATEIGEKKTLWVEASLWKEKEPKISSYLTKGTLVFIEGFPSADAYTDKEGTVRPVQRVNVQKIELLSSSVKSDKSETSEITEA